MLRLLALNVVHGTRTNPNILSAQRPFSNNSWLSVPGNPLIKWPIQPQPHSKPQPSLNHPPSSSPQRLLQLDDDPQNPNLLQKNCATICDLLRAYSLSPGQTLEFALDQTKITPSPSLVQMILDHFDSSPKPVYAFFLWAEKQPSYRSAAPVFNSMVDILAKGRDFGTAWSLLLDRLDAGEAASMISGETFAILIRRYARAAAACHCSNVFVSLCRQELTCSSSWRCLSTDDERSCR